MQFDKYGNNNEDNDGLMWQNDEYAAPTNSNFRMFNNRGGFRRRRGSYNNTCFFNEPEPPLVPRLLEAGFGPSFEWGRGYGPAGPPMPHKYPRGVDTITFLLRCGVPHHILNGLPNSLLRMMEPVLCGVCAQEFNNFDAARFHYTSKIHIKNVKKWLSEQAKVVSQRPKEVPFRARDLYCELCDIHITSKAHAESHYAGRSHRSIVEGRKPPKNVFLLQKNMQERLVKLIRREKRSLKPIEKAAAAEVVKTPPKPTPPELFCKVCQTSVTCSEQMTMHLNGKKHLAKEKRHILNMMQDGKNIHNPAESADTAKDADAQGTDAQGADTQEKEDTNGHEDDGEWSAWDDIPQ